MALFDIEFITPTRSFDIQDVEYAKCPGLDGSFGVMANHTDSVISISAGEIKVLNNSKESYFSTGGGYAEISSNRLLLLVDSVESQEEIDEKRARNAVTRAKERLSSNNVDIDIPRAEHSLARALSRLSVSNR